MTSIHPGVARAALAGGIVLTGAVVAGGTAGATSAALEYSCDYGFAEEGGTAAATASFDFGIGDGVVVEQRQTLSLDPFTGSITLPDDFTQLLRDHELSSIEGGGESFRMPVEGGDGELDVNFAFAATDVPTEGPLTLQVRADGIDLTPKEPGPHTIHAGDFLLFVETGAEVDPGVGMSCTLTDEGNTSIDTFRVTAAATPTPPQMTVTATVTPVRPALVQTDFVEEEGNASLPVLLGTGLLTLGGGAAALRWTGRRSASRRH